MTTPYPSMPKAVIRPIGATQIAFAPVSEIADVKFTKTERLVMNALIKAFQIENGLSSINPEDLTTEEFCVPDEFLCSEIGWENSKNFGDLKNILSKLNTQPLIWNILGKDKSPVWDSLDVEKLSSFTQCTFIQGFRRKGSKTFFRFNEIMLEQLKRPKLYAKIDLISQLNMDSPHGIILYEFFECELGMTSKDSLETAPLSLEDLRRLLGISNDSYKQFKFFKRDVLKVATEEVNKHTSIEVEEIIPIKSARTTVGVSFKISRKFQLSLVDNQNIFELDENDWISKLNNLGASEKVIKSLHTKSGDKRLMFCNAVAVENYTKKKEVKSLDALIRTAFKEGWGQSILDKEIKEEKQRQMFQKREELRSMIAGLDNEIALYTSKYQEYKKELFLSEYDSLSKPKQQSILEKFKKECLGNFILRKYNTPELTAISRDEPALFSVWFEFLQKLLCLDVMTLEEFSLKEGVDLLALKNQKLELEEARFSSKTIQ